MVFNILDEGNIRRALMGDPIGTVVMESHDDCKSYANGAMPLSSSAVPVAR